MYDYLTSLWLHSAGVGEREWDGGDLRLDARFRIVIVQVVYTFRPLLKPVRSLSSAV